MHTVILNVLPVESAFITKVLFKLFIDVVHNRLPAVKKTQLLNEISTENKIFTLILISDVAPLCVVDSVTEARRVYDG